jgi:Fe-S cluster assembly ATP-binding protein
MEILDFKEEFLTRSLNHGFSGGEKKKLEMLQMLVIEPSLIILDEIDSGLDIDAISAVAKAVNFMQRTKHSAVLVITHYARILHFLQIDRVHLLQAGRLVRSGDAALAAQIEAQGFKQFS